VEPRRTLVVVTEPHKRYYAPDLADVHPSRIVVQPANRGTTPAILFTLLRLLRLDDDPLVAVVPADHHYSADAAFQRAMEGAFHAAANHPRSLVLLGVEPEDAEVEYGWIEPGAQLRSRSGERLFQVERFWEKPGLGVAQTLMEHGGLWNTFVMIGRAAAFLALSKATVPELVFAFESAAASPGSRRAARIRRLYDALAIGDFSRQVLTYAKEHLAVLRMENSGWSDLGKPERVIATLAKEGINPGWLGVPSRALGKAG
jgi:mannose-1-phosphate guanylyltransferase